MNNVQDIWLGVPLLEPQVLAGSATATSAALDITLVPGATSGDLRIALRIGTNDTAVATLKLQGSYDNSNYFDVVGSRYGTDADVNNVASVLPTNSTQKKWYGWILNLRGGSGAFPSVAQSGPGPYRYYKVVAVMAASGSGGVGAQIFCLAEFGLVSNKVGTPDYNQGFTELLAVPLVTPTSH
jgi:hypothetical protein